MRRWLHRLWHLLHMQRCTLEWDLIDGHLWHVLRCAECGQRDPFFHSAVCHCKWGDT